MSPKDGIFKDASKTFMTLGFNHQEIVKAGEKAMLPINKGKSEDPEGYAGARIYNTDCKSKCFRSGRVACTYFSCRKVPLLEEVVRRVQFVKTGRFGLAPLYVTQYLSSHYSSPALETG